MSHQGRKLGDRGWSRRRVVTQGTAWGLAAAVAPIGPGRADEITFFQIGTGSTAGTYFPVGGLIASAISKPPGSRACGRGGSCGVPGLIGVAVSTEGSVANVEAVADGSIDSGLTQADVLYWAYSGSGIFAERGARPNLRTIANLFPEAFHVVVRRDVRVGGIADLAGKRVSLDRAGSGTRVDAELVLSAYGVTPGDLTAVEIGANQAIDRLRADELDAFFFVAGTPANAVTELAEAALVTLVPIEGPEVATLIKATPFFSRITIPSGTYFNIGETPSLAVGAQWTVGAEASEELVYGCTRALWHDITRPLLDNGHPKGKLIQIETALNGLGAPLHPGAERYYREIGLLTGPAELSTPSPPAEESQ